MLADIIPDAVDVSFPGTFRSMNANDNKPLVDVGLMPGFYIWLDIAAVLAAESPEFNEHDLPSKVGQAFWAGI